MLSVLLAIAIAMLTAPAAPTTPTAIAAARAFEDTESSFTSAYCVSTAVSPAAVSLSAKALRERNEKTLIKSIADITAIIILFFFMIFLPSFL